MSETKKPEPVFKSRVGAVEANVWQNTGEKGDYFTISTQRSYKDKKDEWQTTNSLRVNDVPDMTLALAKCYEFAKIKVKEEGA